MSRCVTPWHDYEKEPGTANSSLRTSVGFLRCVNPDPGRPDALRSVHSMTALHDVAAPQAKADLAAVDGSEAQEDFLSLDHDHEWYFGGVLPRRNLRLRLARGF